MSEGIVKRFAGRVAIVSGAGSGIGRAASCLLAAQGAAVVAVSVGEGRAEAVAAQIRDDGGQAIGWRCDVGDESGVRNAVALAVETFGGVDVVVNNAGIAAVSPIENTDAQVWDSVHQVSLRGAFLLSKHAVPHLKARGGAIVNISSESGLGHAYMSGYSAAKEGMIGLTRSLARELGPFGIRCNALRPRATGTRMSTAHPAEMAPYAERAAVLGRYRIGARAGVGGRGGPESVAPVVVWLCSDAARAVNGRTIGVEGEMLLLWSEPTPERMVACDGQWTLDQLDRRTPSSLVAELADDFRGNNP